MKAVAVAVFTGIGLAWMAEGAPTTSVASASLPPVCEVEQLALWLGLGLCVLVVGYFIAEVRSSRRVTMGMLGEPRERRDEAVVTVINRERKFPKELLPVLEGPGPGLNGLN